MVPWGKAKRLFILWLTRKQRARQELGLHNLPKLALVAYFFMPSFTFLKTLQHSK